MPLFNGASGNGAGGGGGGGGRPTIVAVSTSGGAGGLNGAFPASLSSAMGIEGRSAFSGPMTSIHDVPGRPSPQVARNIQRELLRAQNLARTSNGTADPHADEREKGKSAEDEEHLAQIYESFEFDAIWDKLSKVLTRLEGDPNAAQILLPLIEVRRLVWIAFGLLGVAADKTFLHRACWFSLSMLRQVMGPKSRRHLRGDPSHQSLKSRQRFSQSAKLCMSTSSPLLNGIGRYSTLWSGRIPHSCREALVFLSTTQRC